MCKPEIFVVSRLMSIKIYGNGITLQSMRFFKWHLTLAYMVESIVVVLRHAYPLLAAEHEERVVLSHSRNTKALCTAPLDKCVGSQISVSHIPQLMLAIVHRVSSRARRSQLSVSHILRRQMSSQARREVTDQVFTRFSSISCEWLRESS